VDYFREDGRIMIATEAGAEGINLQFCSLVVNYDLPWNPQRIEQRIGRCHRYGQKHDVVVVNFLNRKNAADQRVFELLSEKFRLFEGVFGTSDEVLGAIESGVDFEKRIAGIYQRCRRPDEIAQAFDQLQRELSSEINASMTRTRQQLLENFDDEVREKLRVRNEDAHRFLTLYERGLMKLTRYELAPFATFINDSSFRLERAPFPTQVREIPLGLYELPRRSGDAHLYRSNHPLAEALIAQARQRTLPPAEICFDYQQHGGKISLLAPLVGASGWLAVSQLSIETLDQGEDHLIAAAVLDDGRALNDEVAARLMLIDSATVTHTPLAAAAQPLAALEQLTAQRQHAIQQTIAERNARFFEAEAEKLDGWADDLKSGLEREIKDLDRQIKEARRAATVALTLEEKLTGQKQVKALEMQRNQKRRSLFDAQDDVDRRRSELIEQIEGKLAQNVALTQLFVVRWTMR
ncbi:DEAD/DEAH box helicase, partial [Kouleothrix aurantiaca]